MTVTVASPVQGGKKATIPMAPRTAEAVDAYVDDR